MAFDAADDPCGSDAADHVDRAVGIQSDDAACRHKDVEIEVKHLTDGVPSTVTVLYASPAVLRPGANAVYGQAEVRHPIHPRSVGWRREPTCRLAATLRPGGPTVPRRAARAGVSHAYGPHGAAYTNTVTCTGNVWRYPPLLSDGPGVTL
jgi:hypothetical protein